MSYNIIFGTQCGYFTVSNGVFKFKFLAAVVTDISGGPKCTLGGPAPPGRYLAEKMFVPEAITLPLVIVLLISTF